MLRKFLTDSYLAISFFLLITALYLNKKQRDNIESLAVQAVSLEFSLRVILNFVFLILFLVLYFTLLKFSGNTARARKIQLTQFKKFLISTLLIAISIVPAVVFTSKFQHLADNFYGLYSIGHQKPNFLDLRAVLSGMSSVNSIGDNFNAACPGACVTYGWSYPQFLLDLDFLKISEADTYRFASTFALLYLLALLAISQNQISIFLISAWTLTASSMLLFERMNFEILVPTLIILNLHLLQRYPKVLYILPVTVLFLANLKFYPLILIPAFLIIYRKGLWWLLYNTFVFVLGIYMLYDDYLEIGIASVSFGYSGTFGLKTYLGLLSGGNPSFYLDIGVPLLIFTLLAGVLIRAGFKSNLVVNTKLFSDQLFYFGCLLTLAAWALSSNYQYRMVTVVLLIPYLATHLRDEPKLLGAIFIGYFTSALTAAVSLAPMRNALFTGASLLLLGVFVRLTLRNFSAPLITPTSRYLKDA